MAKDRTCVDCGAPVSVRARRCASCKTAFRAANARDRRAAESGGPGDDNAVDYTRPEPRLLTGPEHRWVSPFAARPMQPADDSEPRSARVDDPRVRNAARWDDTKIPALDRHDKVRFDQARADQVRDQRAPAEKGWTDLMQDHSGRFSSGPPPPGEGYEVVFLAPDGRPYRDGSPPHSRVPDSWQVDGQRRGGTRRRYDNLQRPY